MRSSFVHFSGLCPNAMYSLFHYVKNSFWLLWVVRAKQLLQSFDFVQILRQSRNHKRIAEYLSLAERNAFEFLRTSWQLQKIYCCYIRRFRSREKFHRPRSYQWKRHPRTYTNSGGILCHRDNPWKEILWTSNHWHFRDLWISCHEEGSFAQGRRGCFGVFSRQTQLLSKAGEIYGRNQMLFPWTQA